MKFLFSVVAAVFFTAGANAQSKGPEEVFDRFAQALDTGDLPALMALHTADAILVPSGSGPMVMGASAIEAYYKALFSNTKGRRVIKVPGQQWQVYGDTAIRTSNGMFEVETANGKNTLPLRNTYVFHKEGPDWKLVNTHVSARTAQTSGPSAASSAAAK